MSCPAGGEKNSPGELIPCGSVVYPPPDRIKAQRSMSFPNGHGSRLPGFFTTKLNNTTVQRGFSRSWDHRRHVLSTHVRAVSTSAVTIRNASEEEFWAAADVHCTSFYPNAGFLVAPFIKIDRVISMMDGNQLDKSNRGRFVCLIAVEKVNDNLSEPPFPLSLLQFCFPERVGRGVGIPHSVQGVLGTMVMDDTGQHIPSIYTEQNGEHIWRTQKGCAYLSNLAVSPDCRGKGIGRNIVQEAERIAREWGCWCCALHCDPDNAPAFKLYSDEGYVNPRETEGAFRDLSNGHVQNGNLQLLVKLL